MLNERSLIQVLIFSTAVPKLKMVNISSIKEYIQKNKQSIDSYSNEYENDILL